MKIPIHRHAVGSAPIWRTLFCSGLLATLFSLNTFAQSDIKESQSMALTNSEWSFFQDHRNVEFSGQLGNCDTREILKLKVVNRNPQRQEVRVSFLNGTKRLAIQTIVLQPMQEIEVSCDTAQPIFLADGKTVRIETQVTQQN